MADQQVIKGTSEEIMALLQSGVFAGCRMYLVIDTDRTSNLVEAQSLPTKAEADVDVLAARFHALVDRDFLGVLTPEEKQELEALTRWRDHQKADFYAPILQKNGTGS